jgi:hypothetical protein
VQTGLLPGFDNWDIFTPLGVLLATAFMLQRVTGSTLVQIVVAAALAVLSFFARMWLKDNFAPKHIPHWFNWILSADVLLPEPDPDPVPLVIAMPERSGRIAHAKAQEAEHARL